MKPEDVAEEWVKTAAEAMWNAMPQATRYAKLTDAATRLADSMACRAIAAVIPAIQAQEREACWELARDEMLAAQADIETSGDGELVGRLQSQGAESAAQRIAAAIRARNTP